MFRKEKDIVERSQTLMKNKEIKQFKDELIKQFPYFKEHNEDLNELLPNKCALSCTKLANRTLLYSLEGNVLFFDIEGRNNLFPTIATLGKFPDLLITFYTWGPVSRYILNGADFMIPGIATPQGLELLKEKSKCCLKIVGNPVPFAVGSSMLDYSTLTSVRTRKGKALTVIHSWGDFISPKIPPNEGFKTTIQITPTEKMSEENEKSQIDYDPNEEDDDDNAEGTGEGEEKKESVEGEELPLEQLKITEDDDQQEEGEEGEREEPEIAGSDHQEDDNQNDSEEEEQEQRPSKHDKKSRHQSRRNQKKEQQPRSGESDQQTTSTTNKLYANDEELLTTLVLSLKYFIKDKQLPMLVSTFWALLQKYVQNENMIIDIKKTSYKKVSNFLINYCQNSLGLLTCAVDTGNSTDNQDEGGENNGVLLLVSINRNHELFPHYKIHNLEAFKEEIKQRELKAHLLYSESTTLLGGQQPKGKINAIELVKFPKKLKEIFQMRLQTKTKKEPTPQESVSAEQSAVEEPESEEEDENSGPQYGEYLKISEFKELLVNYIKLYSLELPDKRSHVIVTSEDPLYEYCEQKSSAKKESSVPLPPPAASVPTVMPPVIDQEEEEYYEDTTSTVFPSSSSSGYDPWKTTSDVNEFKLKIHKDGLKDVNSLPFPNTTSSNNNTGATRTGYQDSFPTLGSTKAGAPPATSKIAGGSRVGGWGRDPSKPFKPVELPPSKPKTTPAISSSSNNSMASIIKEQQQQQSKEKKAKKTESSSGGYDEVRILQLSKEELLRMLVAKMIPYHAIILPDGTIDIHSGGIPKITILTERRAGNKVKANVYSFGFYFLTELFCCFAFLIRW
jgi:predicted ribosome-associated RNA-binding protein Tma20